MLGAATKSALGHAAAILAAWAGLPALFDEPPPTEAVVTVALAPIAERRNLPDAAAEIPPAPPEPPPAPEAAPEPPAPMAALAPPPPAAKPPPPPPRPARPEPAPEAPPAARQEAPLPDALEPPKPRPRPPQRTQAEPEPKPEPPRRDFERALEQIDDLEAELARRGPEDEAPAPETAPAPEPAPAEASPIDRLLAQTQTPEPYRPGAPLSMTEIDAIRAQIQRNWAVPAGAENAHETVVALRLQLAGDGAVIAVDVVDRARMTADSFYRTMAESAVRAVRRTARIEGLSPEKHALWRDIVLRFNPKDMFRR